MMSSPSTYWSLAMEGVPFGLRHLSKSHAIDAAEKLLKVLSDCERIHIVKVVLYHETYVTKPTEYDPFKGVGL